MSEVRISFYGGVGTPTGSNFVLEVGESKFMVDCGLFQGERFCEEENYKPFAYDPSSTDSVIVTHAHLDHIGRLPKLVHDGFRGQIHSTHATKELAELMFQDGLSIMSHEVQGEDKKPLYDEHDVVETLGRWETHEYHDNFNVAGDVTASLKDAGHILGSAMVEATINEKKVVFTGDLGNSPAPLLRDTEKVTDATYMVIESVYGNRTHEDTHDRLDKLEAIVERVIHDGGVLLVPAFSIERTQVLLYELNSLVENGKIPSVPVFLDSPLAIKVTDVYKRSQMNFNERTKHIIASGDDIFNFPKLSFTETVGASKDIADVPSPKIIIAGSGMSDGGRIVHHEKKYLEDPKNAILFVGYQAAGSLGRQILDGAREVVVDGASVVVRANIHTIFSYSAHKDVDGLVDFVDDTSGTLKGVFVTMGEFSSSQFLAQRLRDYLGVRATVPKPLESISLDL